jgi:hypothetical protein
MDIQDSARGRQPTVRQEFISKCSPQPEKISIDAFHRSAQVLRQEKRSNFIHFAARKLSDPLEPSGRTAHSTVA